MRGRAESDAHMHIYIHMTLLVTADLAPVAAARPAAVYASCFLQCPDHACLPLPGYGQALHVLTALSLVLSHVDIPLQPASGTP